MCIYQPFHHLQVTAIIEILLFVVKQYIIFLENKILFTYSVLFSQNLIGYLGHNAVISLAHAMMRLMHQDSAIWQLIAPFLTNEIARFATDFKMNIIKYNKQRCCDASCYHFQVKCQK